MPPSCKDGSVSRLVLNSAPKACGVEAQWGGVGVWGGVWGGSRATGQGRVSRLSDDFGDAVAEVHLPKNATRGVRVLAEREGGRAL